MRQLLSELPWFQSSSSSRHKKNRGLKVRWVLPNQLAVGRCIQSGEESTLKQAGIQSVLALCDETEASIPSIVQEHFHVTRYPLPDSRQPVLLRPTDMMTALNILHSNIVHHRPTYVHCLAGMERSPTLCIAYLCLFKGYGLWESLNWVKQINPRTRPTEAQLDVVRSLIDQQQETPPFMPHTSSVQQRTGLAS